MRSSDTEAIAILTQIRAGVVSNNYDRLLNNYLTRGNSSRNREVVTILTKMRNTSPDVLGYDLLIGNYFRRGDNSGNRLISQLLTQIRDSMLTPVPVIPLLTNAQKLSLPANTAVGTQVNVTDAIHVTGSGEPLLDGWYLWTPMLDSTPGGGFAIYTKADGCTIQYSSFRTDPSGGGADTTQWGMMRPDGSPAYWGPTGDDGGGDPTAVAAWNTSSPVDRPPFAEPPAPTVATETYTQKLIAPSLSVYGVALQGAPAVDGGFDNRKNGIYLISGTHNGRTQYEQFGTSASGFTDAFIRWNSSLVQWEVYDADNGINFYSASDVATPDLAVGWKNYSDDSDTGIAVVTVIKGDFDAGATITGDEAGIIAPYGYSTAGGSAEQGYSTARPRYFYVTGPAGSTPAEANPVTFYVDSGSGFVVASRWQDNRAAFSLDKANFIWQVSSPTDQDWISTITRNDVATEANWIPGP